MHKTQNLKVKKLHPDAILPKYNYPTDSGFDLHSVEEVIIPPLGRAFVPTGLSFQFNENYEIQVRTKSGLAINQGLMVLNSPGTVDQGYSGEIKAIIFNTNQAPVIIPKGMKVAQAVLCPVVNGGYVEILEVEELNETDRGDNGFGSTGII
jgi:dUTP pyrophosphatase